MKQYLAPPNVPSVATPESIKQYQAAYRQYQIAILLSAAIGDDRPSEINATRYDRDSSKSAYASDGMQRWIKYWDDTRERDRIKRAWQRMEDDYTSLAAQLRARYVDRMAISSMALLYSCSERSIYRALDRGAVLFLALVDLSSRDHDARYLAAQAMSEASVE